MKYESTCHFSFHLLLHGLGSVHGVLQLELQILQMNSCSLDMHTHHVRIIQQLV